MATAASVKAKLQALIAKANAKTGNTATDITSAVNQLVAGYGQGGGTSKLTQITLNNNGTYTASNFGYDGFSQVIVDVEADECTGTHIIEVDTLPTTNIDRNAVYKCGDSYYRYGQTFTDVVVVTDSNAWSMDAAMSAGGSYEEHSFNIIPTKTTENVKVSRFTSGNYAHHYYYIEDENDVFWYGDVDSTGINAWVSYGSQYDSTFNGVVSDISKAAEKGYYAIGGIGWTRYFAPNGALKITENGTHDIAEYASVTVAIEGETTVVNNGVPIEVTSAELELVANKPDALALMVDKIYICEGTLFTVVEESDA